MSKLPLVFSVTSGKGGVGKTSLSANLAYCLAQSGKKVILLDADLGLANIDVILGLTPEYSLFHLFYDNIALGKILTDTPYGFKILPATSGVSEMLELSTGQKLELLESMDEFEENLDYMIVDTGAGINDNVMYFNLAAQERVVVLTPEPTSLTDAYALIKVMTQNHGVQHFKIVVNMASDKKNALYIFKRLYNACDHFLAGVSLELAGFVPRDPVVRKSIMEQRPFCMEDAGSPACRAVRELAETVQKWEIPVNLDGNIKFFWKKLLFRAE
jgi:flagellar biosynthesis protein FlhG